MAIIVDIDSEIIGPTPAGAGQPYTKHVTVKCVGISAGSLTVSSNPNGGTVAAPIVVTAAQVMQAGGTFTAVVQATTNVWTALPAVPTFAQVVGTIPAPLLAKLRYYPNLLAAYVNGIIASAAAHYNAVLAANLALDMQCNFTGVI